MKRDSAYKGEICKMPVKLQTQIKNIKKKRSTDKMVSQFLRAKSIFTNLVIGNGAKNLNYAHKCTGVVV